MRKNIWKWFWVWDFEKEEEWLNEMAREGLALVGYGWCRYEFEPCELGVIKTFIAVIGGLNLYIAVYNLILFAMMRIGFNLLGLLNLAIGIAAMIGVYRLHRKQEHLRTEQNLFE